MEEQNSSRQILVIDDEVQVRELLQNILERKGFDVLLATNGKEGLKIYHQMKPVLIITDLLMPEKEGIEMIIELKQDNPKLPVIAISGGGKNSPESYLSMAKLLGADAVIEKPFKKAVLLDNVEQLLING